MKTPICDFVNKYIASHTARLHMPGHKGVPLLGMEQYDITEMNGADSLFEADGIIKESEKNASELFGAHTFYSTEGSSLCIRAMLYLACLYAKEKGQHPRVLAARNAHKSFVSAAALLDFDLEWLFSDDGYLSCKITAEKLEKVLGSVDKKPTCVYITSPDYLGNISDIGALAGVCHAYGVLLLVDNAHGAYLKFTEDSCHPMDLGADMCCDSAHKTLPALTGGAYLHINKKADPVLKNSAKDAMCLFASTSPSYLILQSLDRVNAYLSQGYRERLSDILNLADGYKGELASLGYSVIGDERLKITLNVKNFGYTGTYFADILRKIHNVECDFADPDYIVFMLSPDDVTGAERLMSALRAIPKSQPISVTPPTPTRGERALTVREAVMSPWETVPTENAEGRALAVSSVACPPAVPILIPGEIIDKNAITAFNYYGIKTVKVIKL